MTDASHDARRNTRPDAGRDATATHPAGDAGEIVHFGSRVFSVDLDPVDRLLSLRGELDDAAAPVLRSALAPLLAAHGTGDVTVDLRPLRFVDSYGVTAVLSARTDLTEHGNDVRLLVPAGHIGRVFGIVAPDVPTRVV